MGTLNVYTQPHQDFNQASLQWSRTGDAGPTWRLARVTVPPSDVDFNVSVYCLHWYRDFFHAILSCCFSHFATIKSAYFLT